MDPPSSPGRDVRTRWRGAAGQTAGEYLGIIVVVATIVVVLTTTDLGATIREALIATLDRVVNGR